MSTQIWVASVSTWNIVAIIVAGIWIPMGILGVLYLMRQRNFRFERYRAEEASHFTQEQQHQLSDLYRRFESFLPAIMERLPERVAESVGQETRADAKALRAAVAELKDAVGPRALDPAAGQDNSRRQLLSEISHALNTPLSQAEAAAVSTGRALEAADADRDLIDQLSQVPVSVTICKAFLLSFRLLATGATTTEDGSALELEPAVRQAAELYRARDDREVDFDISEVAPIAGYDSSYVLATIVPLVENAVECAPDGSTIRMRQSTDPESTSVSISNPFLEELPDDIYRPGNTTKPGHDGLGLATVRRLLHGAGGNVIHTIDGNRVTFTVVFPSSPA